MSVGYKSSKNGVKLGFAPFFMIGCEYMITNDMFFVDLSRLSVFELSYWLLNRLRSVYKLREGGNNVYEIDTTALETLYDDFMEAMNISGEEKTIFDQETYEILMKNKKVFASAKYKKAIIALYTPFPKVLLDIGPKKSLDITQDVFRQPLKAIDALVNNTVDSSAQKYKDSLDIILQWHDMKYRQEVLEFIRTRKTKRGHVLYQLPKNEKWFEGQDIDHIINRLANTNIHPLKQNGPYAMSASVEMLQREENNDKARLDWLKDYNQRPFGGLQELQNVCISYSMKSRYGDGEPVKKDFLIRLAFFLGIPIDLVEKLLLNEGFSIKNSVRPTDIIYRSSFQIGFPFEFADKLLRMKGLPPLILDPKPKKKKEGSLEA